MRILVLISIVLVGSAFQKEPEFKGRIWYRHTFSSADNAAVVAFFGPGQWSYLGEGMYKVLDEQLRLKQLYTPSDNKFRVFHEGKMLATMDAGKRIAGEIQLTALPDTATILGYVCRAIRMEENGVETTYFYSPQLRVNPALYKNHLLGGWNSYMQATNGGLTLRYIINDPKRHFRMVSQATKIEPLALLPTDFSADPVKR